MADDGILTTVDEETENTRAARQAFADAGVPTQRTRLITGRPLEVLSRLADGAYDMVFLTERRKRLLATWTKRSGCCDPAGWSLFDRVLCGRRVPDPAQRDAATIAMRTLLSKVVGRRAGASAAAARR